MADKKKKKSKLKRLFKGLKKAVLLGGAAYGASKLFGGRGRGAVSTVGQPVGVGRVAAMPAHLGLKSYKRSRLPEHLTPDMGASAYVPSYAERAKKYRQIPKIYAGENELINMKHGGRVTGAAKRGFGRALMKGKK